MKIWKIFLVVYIILGGVNLYYVKCVNHKQVNPESIVYLAKRELPIYYRIRPEDLTIGTIPGHDNVPLPAKTEIAGKYTRSSVCINSPLESEELDITPRINVPPGKIIYFFPLRNQPILTDILNAGSRVDVCAGRCDAIDVKVVSVVISEQPSPSAYALLELCEKQAAKISKSEDQYRIILRSLD